MGRYNFKMTKVTIGGALVLTCGFLGYVRADPTPKPEPMTRCIAVQPICPPGKHAICICKSDISMKCEWVCASQ